MRVLHRIYTLLVYLVSVVSVGSARFMFSIYVVLFDYRPNLAYLQLLQHSLVSSCYENCGLS